MAGGAWQGVCMVGGMCGRVCAWQVGCAWQGPCGRGICGRGCVCHARAPHYEIRSFNARAVRILLECILVFDGTDFWTNWGNVFPLKVGHLYYLMRNLVLTSL